MNENVKAKILEHKSEIVASAGIRPQAVYGWFRTRVPAERVHVVARITGMRPHEIRPDIFRGRRLASKP